jgi:peptidoglycan/LPS O-acetylase OafA/YrhL
VRAIAVLAVIAFHASYGRIRGGYLGVEMFFVLSGFLITTLLLDEWAELRTVKLRHFYARRAARLFPALAITIVGVYAVYLVGHNGPNIRTALLGLLEVVFYVGNWGSAFGHNILGPLGHTWSLAIEEQFYVIFPILLLLALRRGWRPRTLVVVAAGLIAASWLERALFSIHNDAFAYFRSDARAGTLVLGVLLGVVLATPRGRMILGRVASAPIAAFALGVIVVATVITGRGLIAYGVVLPVVAIGTAIIIAHIVTGASLVTKGLALRPLRWIGRRSYGLYLYSFPIVYYVNSQRLRSGHAEEEAVRFGLAFAVAACSYRFVEAPILRRVRFKRVRHGAPSAPTELEHVAPLT